jgi:hypothetical protein
MRELSLHILDIVQNSIAAGATSIEIDIREQMEKNFLKFGIGDNGSGITRDRLEQIADPFVTSRTTRDVGLGLPLLKAAAQRCGGDLEIESLVGKGTRIEASFVYDHIDRAPLGDIKGTLCSLVAVNPEIDFKYSHYYQNREFVFDTGLIKEELGEVRINQPTVLRWIAGFLEDGLGDLYGGDL